MKENCDMLMYLFHEAMIILGSSLICYADTLKEKFDMSMHLFHEEMIILKIALICYAERIAGT